MLIFIILFIFYSTSLYKHIINDETLRFTSFPHALVVAFPSANTSIQRPIEYCPTGFVIAFTILGDLHLQVVRNDLITVRFIATVFNDPFGAVPIGRLHCLTVAACDDLVAHTIGIIEFVFGPKSNHPRARRVAVGVHTFPIVWSTTDRQRLFWLFGIGYCRP